MMKDPHCRKHDTSTPPRRRVMLVDDHPTFRLGLRALFETCADLVVCAEAGDIASARRQIRAHLPEVVLVDLGLGRDCGLDLVAELARDDPTLPVLVLSMRDEGLYAERALQAGARGYLMKHTPGAQIVAAIAQVLAGQVVLSPSVTQRIIQRRLPGKITDDSPLSRLSNRQLQVFEHLGCGRQTRDIAVQMYISSKTVETHIAAIKRRLGVTRLEEVRRQAAVWVNA